MQRKNYSSGTHWETKVGYSRAVRVENYIWVSETTATNKQGKVVGLNDPYNQTTQIIKNIDTALQAVGASLKDVVRTRIYVTDIDNWEMVGQAYAKFFAEIRPACTLVEVSLLISPEILVEMEADAIIANPK
jgi:enamine deaminase RidA (YjgF/YER057c/UK114 family)